MRRISFIVMVMVFINIPGLWAQENRKTATVEILNPEYTRPPKEEDNIKITDKASVEDILQKANYYYAKHDFDQAINLLKEALTKTNEKTLIARINFSLSSNYLEKGIQPYQTSKDSTFYNLSIECAKKSLEVFPNSWQTLGNIATVYLNMGDYKQASDYFSQAEKYLDKNDPNYASLEYARAFADEMGKNIKSK